VGGTAGTIVGTILIPVPILGATVGGIVGSVGGKLLGGVSGIALSKILEVYDKIKASKIKKMTALPQLMVNISPESDLTRGLMNLVSDRDEEERITDVVQKAIDSDSSITSLYPSLKEFMVDDIPNEKYEKAKELTTELFTDDNSIDYFILTPIPDENAPEEFASSTDLLVLRWPTDKLKPWESAGENVLEIDDLNINNE
jgi:gas vesicle protein